MRCLAHPAGTSDAVWARSLQGCVGDGAAGAAEVPEPAPSYPNTHEEAFDFCIDLQIPSIRFI